MKPEIYISKSRFLLAAISTAIMGLTLSACDRRETAYVNPQDTEPPAIPVGVNTITRAQAVLVIWQPVLERDLAGYKIYRGSDNVTFLRIATVDSSTEQYFDSGLDNGATYYYAVTSFDRSGNESNLSLETVFDTPRPQGTDVRLYSYLNPTYDDRSGFDFFHQARLPFDDPDCDIFAEYDTTTGIQTFFIWLGHNGFRIQDMGATTDFDEISYAPNDGWSALEYVEAISTHTYVIQTSDDHYAKIRITQYSFDPAPNITMDWGYQVDPGNRELKIAPAGSMAERSNNGGSQ